MVETIVGGVPMCGPHMASCAERTGFIGRVRAHCRLHHLGRARQSLFRQRSQAWAGCVDMWLLPGHSGLSCGNPYIDFSRRAIAARRQA